MRDLFRFFRIAGLESCDAMSIDWLKKIIDNSFDSKTRTRIYASTG